MFTALLIKRYYYAKMISTPSAGEDVPGIQLKRANGMFKGQLLQTFVFVDEPNANPQDLKSWFTTIQERVRTGFRVLT